MARHSRTALKELWWILITWCAFCAWVIAACAPYYQSVTTPPADPQGSPLAASPSLETVWGLPAWVFWGIAVPWLAATSLTIVFATFCLSRDQDPEDLNG